MIETYKQLLAEAKRLQRNLSFADAREKQLRAQGFALACQQAIKERIWCTMEDLMKLEAVVEKAKTQGHLEPFERKASPKQDHEQGVNYK